MSRILLLGKNGQLGWELHRTLSPLGAVTAWDYPEVDFTQLSVLRQKVLDLHPAIIINAAAYTAVDRAENEPEIAAQVNAAAPGVLAETAKAIGAALIHYSTDYVFNGEKGSPYTEADHPDPLNVYGKSKLEGELAVIQVGGDCLVLRTSWVYSVRGGSGSGRTDRKTEAGFVTKVLQWTRSQTVLRMVTDQVGSPTWARALAEASGMLLARAGKGPASRQAGWLAERRGVYHLAGNGAATRFDWAKEIIRLDPRPGEQILQALTPATTADFPAPARRPLYSALDCTRFSEVFELCLPPWQESLALAMEM